MQYSDLAAYHHLDHTRVSIRRIRMVSHIPIRAFKARALSVRMALLLWSRRRQETASFWEERRSKPFSIV